MTQEYREKIETKLGHICNDVLSLLEKFFFKLIYFNWRIIILQYCDGFPYINVNGPQAHICPHHPELPSHLPSHPVPLVCPRALTLCALPHASNLHG